MPLYEYSCPGCGKFEKLKRSMAASGVMEPCPECGKLSERLISSTHWYMGYKFLKGRNTSPAPEDSGHYPEWDEAYKGKQVLPKVSPAK